MDSTTIIRILAGILFLVLCLLYFYPTFKAMGKRNTGAIFALNLLTGWSTIGWVVALIWALKNDAVALRSDEVQQFTGRDRRIKGFIYILWSIVVLIFAFVIMNHTPQTNTSTQDAAQPSAPATSGDSHLSNASEEYRASDEIISPYEISRNPYKLKGHYGILDTVNVPLLMGTGGVVATSIRYPGGGLKFEKMIDEHTATYSVLVGEGSVIPDGEIAVILPNSDPPDSSRPWRVFVEGPMEGVNGFGAAIQVVRVRFEGYYVPLPPQQPVQATQDPEPVQVENSRPSAAQPEVTQEPKPVPVENPTPPGQPPSVAEIDQQAIALWNQKRYSDAIPLFNRACSAREADACYYLGVMSEFGHGVAQDFSRERELYLKACQAGNRPACNDLGILQDYEPDLLQCKSATLAIMVNRYTGSCNGGDGASCSTLAHMYSYGCGIAKDADKARQLYSKACTAGNQQGCDRLKEMQ
jgi:hypothetical protein